MWRSARLRIATTSAAAAKAAGYVPCLSALTLIFGIKLKSNNIDVQFKIKHKSDNTVLTIPANTQFPHIPNTNHTNSNLTKPTNPTIICGILVVLARTGNMELQIGVLTEEMREQKSKTKELEAKLEALTLTVQSAMCVIDEAEVRHQ